MTLPMPQPPPQAPQPLPPKPAPARIDPPSGSRLEDLLSRREAALARVDEAEKQRDAINTAIKAEAAALAPRDANGNLISPVISIPAGAHWPGLVMRWKRPWRLDTKRLKAEEPATYVRYAVRGDGSWELRAADTRGGL